MSESERTNVSLGLLLHESHRNKLANILGKKDWLTHNWLYYLLSQHYMYNKKYVAAWKPQKQIANILEKKDWLTHNWLYYLLSQHYMYNRKYVPF